MLINSFYKIQYRSPASPTNGSLASSTAYVLLWAADELSFRNPSNEVPEVRALISQFETPRFCERP